MLQMRIYSFRTDEKHRMQRNISCTMQQYEWRKNSRSTRVVGSSMDTCSKNTPGWAFAEYFLYFSQGCSLINIWVFVPAEQTPLKETRPVFMMLHVLIGKKKKKEGINLRYSLWICSDYLLTPVVMIGVWSLLRSDKRFSKKRDWAI